MSHEESKELHKSITIEEHPLSGSIAKLSEFIAGLNFNLQLLKTILCVKSLLTLDLSNSNVVLELSDRAMQHFKFNHNLNIDIKRLVLTLEEGDLKLSDEIMSGTERLLLDVCYLTIPIECLEIDEIFFLEMIGDDLVINLLDIEKVLVVSENTKGELVTLDLSESSNQIIEHMHQQRVAFNSERINNTNPQPEQVH